ncbi:hypothetical protein [Terrabacter aerolatus]|uniref:hypothetical protein n=1 Tax=Terrabacter aerolatus TaxID=422442 RepID=UPI0011BD944F|nr:hypothetical protein [Terrabacter aerolatus]
MLALVMTAATWRPTAGQGALLITGPLVTVAALVGPAWGVLGLLGIVVVPFGYLLVPAVLPWSRPWASWAVPATVVVDCAILAAAPRIEGRLFTLPLIFALVAMVRAIVQLHWTGVPATTEPVGRGIRPGAARAVVVVVTLQGAAALLMGTLGAAVLLGPRANTGSTNGMAMLGSDLALLVAGVAGAVAAMFFGLAIGLRRRYGDFRFVFTIVQVIALVLCVWAGHGFWVWGAAAWVAATVALAYAGAGGRPASTTTAR